MPIAENRQTTFISMLNVKHSKDIRLDVAARQLGCLSGGRVVLRKAEGILVCVFIEFTGVTVVNKMI